MNNEQPAEEKKAEATQEQQPEAKAPKEEPKKKKNWFLRHIYDFILLFVLLVGTGSAYIVQIVRANASSDDPLEAVLYVDKKETERWALYDVTGTQEVVIQGTETEMTIEMKKNAIRVKESGCPYQVCVHEGWVSEAGHPIVCTYNRVIIEVNGSDPSVVVIG
jgi:hypothetical protein